MSQDQRGYVLLACPQCHAGYKIRRDAVEREVTCRTCGHCWEPAQAVAAAAVAAGRAAEPAAPARPPEPPAVPVRAVTPREEKTDPLVGTRIDGFKLVARIGSGGFGVVYRAFDTNLERSVALKMLPPRLAQEGPRLVERFLREARSAAKLSHPNIVTIHQIVPYKDTFYIVMELVDGGALHEFLAVQRRFQPKEATRIIRDAAAGLGHAHRRGIIHRDIKPGNIMMTNDGQVKVSDFGLARDVLQGRDIVGPGHSLGTPRYMAPEQALGEEPTAASDLYALAATYYVLLTGRSPFDAPNDRALMKKHLTEPVPDPRQDVPGLPVAVYRFLQKAMAKQPEDRYQTAEEFVEALSRIDFAAEDAAGTPTPESLSAQLGPITLEDRGSHLSQALGRAVRRAHRQHGAALAQATPSAEATAVARFLSGWRLWVLISAAAAILIGGAVAAALLLAPSGEGPAAPGAARPVEKPSAPAGTGAVAPETPPKETPVKPGETPKTPVGKPAEPKKPPPDSTAMMEEGARQQLEAARQYEKANPDADILTVIQAYENVVHFYPDTKAAEEARQAIRGLRERGEPPPSP